MSVPRLLTWPNKRWRGTKPAYTRDTLQLPKTALLGCRERAHHCKRSRLTGKLVNCSTIAGGVGGPGGHYGGAPVARSSHAGPTRCQTVCWLMKDVDIHH